MPIPRGGLSEEQMKSLITSQSSSFKWEKGKTVFRTDRVGPNGVTVGYQDWRRSDGATAKVWLTGKAGSQDMSGQMELATRQYTEAQRVFDKENGDN